MVRDAGVGLFAVLLILCCGAWVVVQADRHAEEVLRARAFDYSWYLEVCQPRLNGRVICAQPGPGPDSLESLWMRAAPGTTIVLLPGEHSLGDVRTRGRTAGGVKDIWLLGSGAESTTLSLRLESARGVRIEGVTIDCNNTEFADFRDEGSLYLRNCRITNYNSGAGGSNAVFAVGSALLIESCEFEGKSGRASASMRGTAMDLRGRNIVYIRDTEFINNQEVFRNGDGVLDGCTVSTDQPQYYGPPSGDLYVRNTEAPSSRFPANAWKKFSQGLDDLDVLRAIADVRGRSATAWSDPVASEIAGTLGLQRDRGYWVRLLRHPSAEVRRLAAERAGAEYPAPELPVEKAVEALNQTVVSPEAALALMSGGEGARAKLKALVETGAAREKANAAAILRVMDAEPPLLDFLRYEKIRGAK
jgi:hypothetical protein